MVAPKDVGRSVGLRHPGDFWLQKALFLQNGIIGPMNGSSGSRKRGHRRVREFEYRVLFPIVLPQHFFWQLETKIFLKRSFCPSS